MFSCKDNAQNELALGKITFVILDLDFGYAFINRPVLVIYWFMFMFILLVSCNFIDMN